MKKEATVAIQGERGSFSEEAAVILVGQAAQWRSCRSFEEVFRLVADGASDYCVIPIENSLAGALYKNYDLLLRHRLRIVRETNLRIEHHLVSVQGVGFDEIETVMSHPAALDQCDRFFERHPHLKKQTAYDTSGSVKLIMEGNLRNCAAIASKRAAEYYGGQVLMAGIEDNKENYTRFFLLSREPEISDDADKTSIAFSFKNAPGALFKCLSVFALREIDLSKIESRPIHGRPWEYLFYIDFLGNVRDRKVRNALRHLREITEFLQILGCYPRDASHRRKGM
jgi:prephenate dehydratase